MDNYDTRSPLSQVRHEVSIKKASNQDWFYHRTGARVREVFRFSSIQVAQLPSTVLKMIISRNLCIELDGGGFVLI